MSMDISALSIAHSGVPVGIQTTVLARANQTTRVAEELLAKTMHNMNQTPPTKLGRSLDTFV